MKEVNKNVLSKAKKEFIINTINSIILRATVLIIPVIWSYALNHIYNAEYDKAIKLIIFSIIITVIYYGLEQLYQVTLYKLYNKLYNLYENVYTEAFYKNSLFSLSRFSLRITFIVATKLFVSLLSHHQPKPSSTNIVSSLMPPALD